MTSRRQNLTNMAGDIIFQAVSRKADRDKKRRRRGQRPQAYLRMMEKGAAYEAGVKEAFFRGYSARKKLKAMGVKSPKHARVVSQKLFNEAMRYSNPKSLRSFEKLVRTAGW